MRKLLPAMAGLVLGVAIPSSFAASVGTAFTYQGVLENPPGNPLNDTCALEFALCDDAVAACSPGTVSSHPGISVTDGAFTVPNVDFGPGALNGQARWMTIRVKCTGDAAFVTLSPRVELKPAPYALALPGLQTQQNPTSPNIVAGLHENTVTAGVFGATIAGGGLTGTEINRVTDSFGTIGGGANNRAGDNTGTVNDQPWATVGGGKSNVASGNVSTVGGGSDNVASNAATTVAGGQRNTAAGIFATVTGGINNTAAQSSSTVGGGNANTADGNYSTVGGGQDNTASGQHCTIGGGGENSASGDAITIGGGQNNQAQNAYATVAGGVGNIANQDSATVGGGNGNTASGDGSVVPGGDSNEAGGTTSFAAGHRAKVRNATQSGDGDGDQGTFVWADSTNADFASTGPNQFLIRSAGGVGINTNAPTAALTVGGTAGVDGIRFPDGTLQTTASVPGPDGYSLDAADGSPADALYVDDGGNVGIGTITPQEQLDVNGNLRVAGTIAAGATITIDGNTRQINSFGVLGISAVGGVGIGTNNPTAALHVAGTPGVDGIRFPDGTLQTTAAGPGGGGDSYSLDASDGDPVDALLVDGDGKVGIGTITPTHNLDVVGDIHASAAISSGNTIVVDGNARTITSDAALGLIAPGGVGIGTDEPTVALDVVGAARVETLQIFGGTSVTQPITGWGSNAAGQISVPSGSFTKIATGSNHSIGIRTDGTLAGWGNNSSGQINVPAGIFSEISAGSNFSLGLRQDGSLAAWGSNSSGQLNVPTGTFIAVSAGWNHGVAIRSDGTLAAWGSNTQGQTNVPTGTYQKISAGAFHNLAIRTAGTLVAWGNNTYGQTNVPTGKFEAIAAGLYFSLGIRDNGTLAGWGINDTGQINVPQGGVYYDVAAAGTVSFPLIQGFGVAVRSDHALVAWGDNTYGQLNVPVGQFVSVVAGEHHALAIGIDPSPDIALQLTADSAVKPGSDRWTIFSDKRLKTEIEPLQGALDKLLALQGRTFRWRDPATQGGRYDVEMGLIADDVQRVFPQWVRTAPNGYKTLTVSGFEALTAEALRELRAEKDHELGEKEREIQNLKSEISDLREMVEALAAQQNQGGK